MATDLINVDYIQSQVVSTIDDKLGVVIEQSGLVGEIRTTLPTGPQGATGPIGPMGATGPRGITGPVGPVGRGNTVTRLLEQTHTFQVGDLLYNNEGTWTLGLADHPSTAEIIGMVSDIIDENNFEITLLGYVEGIVSSAPLIPDQMYFLSTTVPGGMTEVGPQQIGQVNKPLFFSETETSGFFINYRGIIMSNTP